MEGSHSKELKKALQKVRMPSGHCQACLSDKSVEKDFMITCTLCQSSIHIKHYGKEIDQTNAALTYDGWKCQRCRLLMQLEADHKVAEMEAIKCQFCPSTRGILKRVIYNTHQTIWLHPECSTWPYPIIYQKNSRRIHYNCEFPTRPTSRFWVNLDDQTQAQCQICRKSEGYKIKCMYYTCHKYYHCSCAKSTGFIRDLESMQFQNSDTYIPPYCQEHLELRVKDCQLKADKYRSAGDQGKASHFSQMMSAYEGQLKNMVKSAQKYREQQQIRKQMEYQTGEKDDLIQELSFQENQQSLHSQHNSEFIWEIFDCDYPKPVSMKKKTSPFFFSNQQQDPNFSPNLNNHVTSNVNDHLNGQMVAEQPVAIQEQKQDDPAPNLGQFLQQQPRVSHRQSQPQYSQWQNSDQFNDEDE